MGAPWVIPHVAQHFLDNPNRTVTIGELTRLGDGYSTTQVLAALNKWRTKPGIRDQLTVIIPGRAWRWSDHTKPVVVTAPQPAPVVPAVPPMPRPTRTAPKLVRFEHIGQTPSGGIILRASDGKLYTATPL